MPVGFEDLRKLVRELADAGLNNFQGPAPQKTVLGPCAVESEDQIETVAQAVKAYGATHLRGGAVKLRTRKKSFSGLGYDGLVLLSRSAKRNGLRSVSEITSLSEIEAFADFIDVPQIGARSMWNHSLIEATADLGKPVVLKRGIGATTLEWLAAGERILKRGSSVILCERGLLSYDGSARNVVDLSVLVFLLTETPFETWLDVSHSAGDPKVALHLITAARKLGVHGVMAEVHPAPLAALCDAEQAIPLASLAS